MSSVIKQLAPWLGAATLVWIIQFAAIDYMDPYVFSIVMLTGINMILAASLNLVNGFTGQFSIGHAGFMAVGAYVSALISMAVKQTHPEWLSSPLSGLIFVGILWAGGLASAAAGYAVGLPSLRLKGDYLAIVTLGFGEIIRVVFLNMEVVGAARGLPDIPALSNFGWVFSGVLVTLFVIWRILRSAHGRALLAVREDEIAAEAMGVNTTQAKVRAFVVGAFFAGVAGGLFGHYLRYLNPSIFDFNRSFEIVIMVVLGGMGSLTGSIVAALVLTVLREALRPLQELTQIDFRMVIYSLLLIVLMLTRPNGLFGTREFTHFLPTPWRKRLGGRS